MGAAQVLLTLLRYRERSLCATLIHSALGEVLTELQEFQLFVRNYSPFNASADILFRGKSFGKWLIAHKTQTWQHIGGDTLFEFKDTDGMENPLVPNDHLPTRRTLDRPFKAVEPLASAIEIRFQYLSRVAEGRKRGNLVPVIVRDPSWEDGSGWLPSVSFLLPRRNTILIVRRLSDGLMTSRFKAKEDNAFLTFVASFYTPRTTTSPSVPAPLMVNRNAALGPSIISFVAQFTEISYSRRV